MSDHEATPPPDTPTQSDATATPTRSETTPSTPGGSENGDTTRRPPAGFQQQFRAFSKFGDTKSDGKMITLSQSDKWMKQAKVIDSRTLSTTDTGIAFKKFKQQKIHFKEFEKFLDDLAASKRLSTREMKDKMAKCGPPPGHRNSTSPQAKSNVYDRLCDVSKYGASHRLRFDEAGRGRGIAGRKDLHDNTGYVRGYKNKDTYPTHR